MDKPWVNGESPHKPIPTLFKVPDSGLSLPPLLTAGRKGENRCENPAARLSVTKLAVSGQEEIESSESGKIIMSKKRRRGM